MVRSLLAGEQHDASSLNYNLATNHVAFVIASLDEDHPFPDLRPRMKCRLLTVRADARSVWGWLGGEDGALADDLQLLIAQEWPTTTTITCGEPSEGLEGWRLTHRQATAALPIAEAQQSDVTHYRDVALLAAALRDDLLYDSLKCTYLEPLELSSDCGATAKRTLRAYFAAGRNISAAAAYLGVNRATVRNRLSAIEELLGWAPDAVAAEMELALRLDSLNAIRAHQEVASC